MPFQFLCPQGHLLQGDESQMGLQTQCPLCGVAFIIPHVAPQPAPQYTQQPAPGPSAYPPPQQQYAPPTQPQQQYVPQQPAYAPPQQPAPAPQAPARQPAAQQAPPQTAPKPKPPAEQRKKKPPQQQPARDLSNDLSNDLSRDLSSDLSSDLGSELGGGGLGGLGDGQDVDGTLFHIPCPNGHELETPIDMIGEEALCPHCGVQFKLLERNSLEWLHKQAIIDQQRAHFWFNWAIAAAVVVSIMLLAMLIVALRS